MLFCHVIFFSLSAKFGCRDNSQIIGLPQGKAWFSDDPGCLRFSFSSMLCCMDKVRTSVCPTAGSHISSLNGKHLSKHKWETRIIACHCTGLLCPILSTPPFLPVGNMTVLAIYISSSCEGFACIRSSSLWFVSESADCHERRVSLVITYVWSTNLWSLGIPETG